MKIENVFLLLYCKQLSYSTEHGDFPKLFDSNVNTIPNDAIRHVFNDAILPTDSKWFYWESPRTKVFERLIQTFRWSLRVWSSDLRKKHWKSANEEVKENSLKINIKCQKELLKQHCQPILLVLRMQIEILANRKQSYRGNPTDFGKLIENYHPFL